MARRKKNEGKNSSLSSSSPGGSSASPRALMALLFYSWILFPCTSTQLCNWHFLFYLKNIYPPLFLGVLCCWQSCVQPNPPEKLFWINFSSQVINSCLLKLTGAFPKQPLLIAWNLQNEMFKETPGAHWTATGCLCLFSSNLAVIMYLCNNLCSSFI